MANAPQTGKVYRFGDHVLDTGGGTLRRSDADVAIRSKTYDLLRVFVANAGKVVSKESLLDAVWGKINVSENSLTQCVKDLRQTLRDDDQTIIKTVPKRGYLFAGNVFASNTPEPALAIGPAPACPSIAILPFANLSADLSDQYFADGMAEEIATSLSCVRWLKVISSGSTHAYGRKEAGLDLATIGRELGARYLVTGSIRRSLTNVRVTCRVWEAGAAVQLWAERYDGASQDIFEIQDAITSKVVGALQPTILAAETERSRRKRPESLVAYDYVLKALPLVWRLERESNERALDLLSNALQFEPDYALALSLKAWCHAQRATYNWTTDVASDRQRSLDLAERAVMLSEEDGLVLTVLGAVHTFCRNYERADAVLARARALDVNSAWTWLRNAWLEVFRGEPATAITMFERFRDLSPRDQMGHMALIGIGSAHFVAGHYEESIRWTREGLTQAPGANWALCHLVAALMYAGHVQEACSECLRLVEAYPALRLGDVSKAIPFRQEAADRVISGLRDAGYPG
jgi:adenylate cyclase